MAGFGVSIEEAAGRVTELLPEEERDWSVDAALYLALAYASIKRLGDRGVTFKLAGKLILLPALERAWQELIHIRVRLDKSITEDDVVRHITVSRTGRIIYEGELSSRDNRGRDGYVDDPTEGGEGNVSARYLQRLRSHRNRKRSGTKDAGTGG